MSAGELRERAAACVARGVAFLAKAQLANGELPTLMWEPKVQDPVHDASVFGTALIAWSLKDVPGTEAVRARACDFIEAQSERFGVRRHWTRGHAQFHFVAPDLDDISIACLALAANGRPVPRSRPLFLANRDRATGLFLTWITLRRHWVANFAYWWLSLTHFLLHPKMSTAFYVITAARRHDIDAVVNANALLYLGRDPGTGPVCDFLLRTLRDHRETTCDKWYENPFVVRYFFSRALRKAGVEAADLFSDGTPVDALERALSICVELDWGRRPADMSIESLIASQLPSGAWPRAAFYKGGPVRWGSEAMTTGFCIEALTRCYQLS